MKGIDDAVFAKLELTATDWQRVLETAPFKTAELTPESRGYLEPDDGWWNPGASPSLRATQVTLAKGRILNVGVDASRPGVIILFLMNHGT